MGKNLSDIKLSVGNNLKLNLEDKKIDKLLIAGNTVNFFGFLNNGELDDISLNEEDRNRYFWLLKRALEKTEIYVIGEIEEKEYYVELFNHFGQHGIRVNWKYIETFEPNDYLKIIDKIKNMKFDVCLMNPPYGSVGGDTLHLKFVDGLYDTFNDKMIVIMPFGFINKSVKSFKKYQEKFSSKLLYVKEVSGKDFVDTNMASTAIYEFVNKKENNDIVIEDILGVKNVKNNLIEISKFTDYENNIIKYLEAQSQQIIFHAGGTAKRKKEIVGFTESEIKQYLIKNIERSCERLKEYYNTNQYFSVIVNQANGGMNGTAFSKKNGQIFSSYKDILDFFIERKISNGYNVILCKTIIEAKNCKLALQRPLLRFTIYRTQYDQQMYANKVYKYIPAIDWEDPRCLTDEGILEMCGCPSDKAKEYAQYCKEVIDKVDGKSK